MARETTWEDARELGKQLNFPVGPYEAPVPTADQMNAILPYLIDRFARFVDGKYYCENAEVCFAGVLGINVPRQGFPASDGYSRHGLDWEGFNRDGYNRDGFNREGFNARGYDKDGFDKDGLDRYGCDKTGYTPEGYDRYGFNKDGLDKDGYDKAGYKDGYNMAGYDKAGYNREGFNERGFDKDGYNKDGKDLYGRTRGEAVKRLVEGWSEAKAASILAALKERAAAAVPPELVPDEKPPAKKAAVKKAPAKKAPAKKAPTPLIGKKIRIAPLPTVVKAAEPAAARRRRAHATA